MTKTNVKNIPMSRITGSLKNGTISSLVCWLVVGHVSRIRRTTTAHALCRISLLRALSPLDCLRAILR